MPRPAGEHLSHNELSLYLDEELDGQASEHVSIHLKACAACAETLHQIRQADQALASFQVRVLRPAVMQRRPVAWADSSELMTAHPRGVPDRRSYQHRWLIYATALAAAFAIALIVSRNGHSPLTATALLERSTNVSLPAHRQLRVRTGTHSVYRPAALSSNTTSDLKDVQAMFVSAHYSWEEPLSSRSYSDWRRRLLHKRDEVSLINGERQSDNFYRIRTETSDGVLRTASLTVRQADFQPVEGSFQFDQAETVTISDTGVDIPDAPSVASRPGSSPVTVHRLSASDSLQVLNALSRAGVDVGQGVELLDNPTHTRLIVRAPDIDRPTRSRILRDLNWQTRTALQWEQQGPGTVGGTSPAPEAYSSKNAFAGGIRARLEELFGGPIQLENTAGQALDLSGDVLANAHALAVLAGRVPPAAQTALDSGDRQLMVSLRDKYENSMTNRLSQLTHLLAPIAAKEPLHLNPIPTMQNWQADTPELLHQAQEMNRDIARLLAGGFTTEQGEMLLKQIPEAMAAFNAALEEERRAQ